MQVNRNELAELMTDAGITSSDGVEIKSDGSIRPSSDDDGCTACGGCSGDCYPGCNENHDEGEDCNCSENWNCECEHTCEKGNAFEITIVNSVSKIDAILRKVCHVLNSEAVDAQVNDSCGLHVHLDQRGRSGKQSQTSFRNLVLSQAFLYAMVPVKRIQNQYCRPLETTSITHALDQERYKGVNVQALKAHKTLEVRLHSGTTNADKLINWTKILDAIAYAMPVGFPVRTLAEIRKAFPRIKGDLVNYICDRVNTHGKGKTRPITIDSKSYAAKNFR